MDGNTLKILAEYGACGVALGAIVAIIFIVKAFLKRLDKMDARHGGTIKEFRKSLDKNTKVTEQTYQYLKLRNGAMERMLKKG